MPNRHHKDLYLNWINDPSSGVVAWNVVIPYRKNGERHVWRYAVSKARYGGTKAKLKRIAIELRNRKLFEFRCSGYELFQSKIYVANTSGTTGVREIIDADRFGRRPCGRRDGSRRTARFDVGPFPNGFMGQQRQDFLLLRRGNKVWRKARTLC
jgi:hypothetical protein